MSGAPGKRIALVTGASRGIGRAVALELARQNWHVIAIARAQKALEKLDDDIRALGHGEATLIPLDLKDGASIDQLAAQFFCRQSKKGARIGWFELFERSEQPQERVLQDIVGLFPGTHVGKRAKHAPGQKLQPAGNSANQFVACRGVAFLNAVHEMVEGGRMQERFSHQHLSAGCRRGGTKHHT